MKLLEQISLALLSRLGLRGQSTTIAVSTESFSSCDSRKSLTVIRNGNIDGNPATDREATWQPIAHTPMHPEYPGSHSY
jgi:hypothetical protein